MAQLSFLDGPTMRRLLIEYILKGIFLGLLLLVALQDPGWWPIGQVALFTFGGLVLFLAAAAWSKVRQGYRVKGQLPAFVLFLLLESPGMVYAGILLGLALGAFSLGLLNKEDWLAYLLGGGALLGVLFWLLREVKNRWYRLGLSLVLGSGLVAGALYWFDLNPSLLEDAPVRIRFGTQLLLGIPLFYLLTFAGMAEETEVEIGVMCAGLGLALWFLLADVMTTRGLVFLIPLGLFYIYTLRVLPGLRVFKHVVRGIGFANVGRNRLALQAYRRALHLDPDNKLARESLWNLHRALDLEQVKQDPEILALVNLDLCLDRATSLLLQSGPGEKKLSEAHHLLDLVSSQRPEMQPAIDYWRSVAFTHSRQYAEAATHLERVLEASAYPADDPWRQSVLYPAWQLALTLHPEMNRRVGMPELAKPGRRMEAIAMVERQLAANPEDAGAWDIKRLLYSTLTEADYDTTGSEKAAVDFDHAYTQQLGLALIHDSARWQRGAEYLRMAARGLPAKGPTIFHEISQAEQRAGHPEAVWENYQRARQAGRAVGSRNLAEEDRLAYFSILKVMAEDARARGDFDEAIVNYRLLSESERSGLETLRILADLYERKGDVLGALRTTEQALIFNARDKDLLEKKDRYYFSLTPADLREHLETIRNAFDVDYCVKKARGLLDLKEAGLDLIEWAQHLAELARVAKPDSMVAPVLLARALRRRGEIDQTRALLEEVYQNKPEKFATSADEDAWYLSCRLLGEMYLYEDGRPELAIQCFSEYRKCSRSGADTMYKLGQAYEQAGDRTRAKKFYELVTAYESHPLAPDARAALFRLQSG